MNESTNKCIINIANFKIIRLLNLYLIDLVELINLSNCTLLIKFSSSIDWFNDWPCIVG